jgi:cell division protein FtsB
VNPLEWVGWGAFAVAMLGYLIGQFRRGRSSAQTEALEAQERRISVLEKERGEYRERVAHLEGVVAQLREENQVLRSLVMGETVPPAMLRAMEEVARRSSTELVAAIASIIKGQR